jgi:hypothetical protein
MQLAGILLATYFRYLLVSVVLSSMIQKRGPKFGIQSTSLMASDKIADTWER